MKPFTVADYVAELQKLPQDTPCLMVDITRHNELYGAPKVHLRLVKAYETSTETHDGVEYGTYDTVDPEAATREYLIV